MKVTRRENVFSQKLKISFARVLVVTGFLFSALTGTVQAVAPPVFPGGGSFGPTNVPIFSDSFYDHTNWTSDYGYAPVSFANLNSSYLGNGNSLVVNTNVPAWLNFPIFNGDGTTNLTVDNGSVTFWFAPVDWSSTNVGGTGPGGWTQLLDVGEWTTNSSYGYWGISLDPPGQNLSFVAQDGAGNTYVLSTPVSLTTNYFHCITLTYSATNVSLYLDGQLATSDLGGLSVWPDSGVLSNGIFFGSDTNGVMQAQGLFNTVQTYNYPLNPNDVQTLFNSQYVYYEISPWNTVMANIGSASTTTTTFTPINDVITGAGFLQANGSVSAHNYGTNADQIWITNVTAAVVSNGTTAISFTIEGGSDGYMYDVFGTGALASPLASANWAWLGQGGHFTNYTLNITSQNAFLILGTPQSTTGNGLTDAYELLVLHNSPTNYSTDGTGMADGWEVLYFGHTGVNPAGDPDGDGLNNYQEWQMNSQGYSPVNWDSKTNGVGDGYQNYSGDGLANLMQSSFGGNMLTNNPTWKVNSSGDGFPDEYKVMVGLNTNSAASALGLPVYSMNPIQ